MKVIYKYPLQIIGMQTITLPEDYGILTVGMQEGNLYLWAQGNPSTASVLVDFYIYGTGTYIHTPGNYVGTVFQGPLVWHIYYRDSQ